MLRMYIMRGIPGSGKSTWISKREPGVICSADSFFSKSGTYAFDVALIGEAHKSCFREAMLACGRQEPVVYIDNTCIRAWEIAPYTMLGEACGYDVMIVELRVEPMQAFERGVHGVSLDACIRMHAASKKEYLPLHWKCLYAR